MITVTTTTTMMVDDDDEGNEDDEGDEMRLSLSESWSYMFISFTYIVT